MIFAHRGISSQFPENSTLAIKKGLELEIDGLEIDVELSKDAVPVLIHQETFRTEEDLSRISPHQAAGKNAWTNRFTFQELSGLDCGAWFSEEFSGMRIAKLEEVLELDWKNKSALIELKDVLYWDSEERNAYHDLMVSSVSKMINKFHAGGKSVFILSFSPKMLEAAKDAMPEIPRVQTASTFEALLSRMKDVSTEPIAYCTSETVLLNNPEVVKMAHAAGRKLIVYEHTVYGQKESREELVQRRFKVWEKFRALEVDGIITNFAEAYT